MRVHFPFWLIAILIVMALARAPKSAWSTPKYSVSIGVLCVCAAATLWQLLNHML